MLGKLKAKDVSGKEIIFDIVDFSATKEQKQDGLFYVNGVACYIETIELANIGSVGEATVINPPEKERIYHFPKKEDIVLKNVCEITVRPSGSHRLKTTDGKHHIIPAGWLHIELDIADWTI